MPLVGKGVASAAKILPQKWLVGMIGEFLISFEVGIQYYDHYRWGTFALMTLQILPLPPSSFMALVDTIINDAVASTKPMLNTSGMPPAVRRQNECWHRR